MQTDVESLLGSAAVWCSLGWHSHALESEEPARCAPRQACRQVPLHTQHKQLVSGLTPAQEDERGRCVKVPECRNVTMYQQCVEHASAWRHRV